MTFRPKFYFLHKFSLREKTLLLLLIGTMVGAWGFRINGQWSQLNTRQNTLDQSRKSQQIWLDNESFIDQQLKERLKLFDPSRTYSSMQLVSKIDALARSEDLEPTLFTPISKSAYSFNIHSLRLNFRSVELPKLILFQEKLMQEAPYITLKNLKVIANKKNPALLNADFEILSFELSQDIVL